MTERCGNCRFFSEPRKVGDDYLCRRYPPESREKVTSDRFDSEYAVSSVFSATVIEQPPVGPGGLVRRVETA